MCYVLTRAIVRKRSCERAPSGAGKHLVPQVHSDSNLRYLYRGPTKRSQVPRSATTARWTRGLRPDRRRFEDVGRLSTLSNNSPISTTMKYMHALSDGWEHVESALDNV